ncbi:MAG: flagellar hook assembly protein FlgD [Gammaproteobacteria bacterium]|nr:flagellar hook assembly protein FlgD [Gammaproteobacteria bacterium]
MATAMTSDVLSGLGLRSLEGTQTKTNDTNKLSSDNFMELLIAQIQNQDPMKPMDNAEFISQIATINQVTGIQELKTSFDDLSKSLVSNQALQAAGLIGREVLAPTGLGVLQQNGSIRGSVELPNASAKVSVTIYDSAGQMVRRLELGSQAAGDVAFKWDGLREDGTYAAPGTYLVSADAEFSGKNEAVEAYVANQVSGVTLGSSGGLLLDLNGVGLMDFNQVKQIL